MDENKSQKNTVLGALAYPRMNKEAALDLTDRQKNVAIGAGVGLGAAALLTLARRPGLRAHLRAKGKSLFASSKTQQLAEFNIAGDIPKESVEHARKIIRDLKRQGYSPEQIKKMRIGVVGSSGSGKSSLARALEQELGHTRISLDEFVSYNPLKAGNVDVERGLKIKGGMKPGTIAEQTQLLHSGDPSHFDLLVKIERPAKDIREGLLERGHAAVTADYTDFTKAQRSVNEAFHTAGGTHRNIGNGVEIRVNPLGGKDAAARRVARAQELGLNINEFKALSQRDQIQSLARGKMTRKQSFRGHISSGALGQDIGIGSALLFGGGATGALMSREKISSYEIPPHLQAEPMSRADKEARAHAALFGLGTEKVAGWGTTALAVGVPAAAGAGIGALASDPGDRFSGAVVGGLTGAGIGLAGKAAVGKFNEASSAIAGQSAKTAPGAGITEAVKTSSYKHARIHAALEKVAFGAGTNALIGAGAGGLIGAAAGGPDNRFGGLLAGAALGAGGAYGGTKLLAGGADDAAKAVTKASPAPAAADDVAKATKGGAPSPTPTTQAPAQPAQPAQTPQAPASSTASQAAAEGIERQLLAYGQLDKAIRELDDVALAPGLIQFEHQMGRITSSQANRLARSHGLNMEKFSSLRRRIMNVI